MLWPGDCNIEWEKDRPTRLDSMKPVLIASTKVTRCLPTLQAGRGQQPLDGGVGDCPAPLLLKLKC